MAFDSDVVLIGTGLAPLIAAHRLTREGRSALILNPERDFFLEDSELPLDPSAAAAFAAPQTYERAVETLLPEYPGALERWSADEGSPTGFRDPLAPHVRGRARIWTFAPRSREGDGLERFYVGASDAGLRPQLHEGLAALHRFPGMSSRPGAQVSGAGEALQGVLLPRLWDADVERYRSGVLEFLRERLGSDRILCGVSQIETTPEGVRFFHDRQSRTARVRSSILAFWTPKTDSWAWGQCKKFEREAEISRPGFRLWEDWALHSRDPVETGVIGVHEGMTVWADFDGAPSENRPVHRLRVLRSGSTRLLDADPEAAMDRDLASSESIAALKSLCHGFLRWEKFAIRGLRPRLLLDWKARAPTGEAPTWRLRAESPTVDLVAGADGSIVDVVRAASQAAGRVE